MRSGLTKPIPFKGNCVIFAEIHNVVFVKQEWPPLRKSVVWLIEPTDRVLCQKNSPRRFPPPWFVEELDACYVVRDHDGQALSYIFLPRVVGIIS